MEFTKKITKILPVTPPANARTIKIYKGQLTKHMCFGKI
jgi:hypothetical protein